MDAGGCLDDDYPWLLPLSARGGGGVWRCSVVCCCCFGWLAATAVEDCGGWLSVSRRRWSQCPVMGGCSARTKVAERSDIKVSVSEWECRE